MRRFIAVLALVLLVLVPLTSTVGCACKGMIRADAIDGLLNTVADRHDAYVIADPNMTEADKATALRSTDILRQIVEEAKKHEAEEMAFAPVGGTTRDEAEGN